MLKTLADTFYSQRLVEIIEERVSTTKYVKEDLKFLKLKEMTVKEVHRGIRERYVEIFRLLLHRGRHPVWTPHHSSGHRDFSMQCIFVNV